jgi:hypothetical protein
LHFHGKTEQYFIIIRYIFPNSNKKGSTASYQGNDGYAKAPQGNVESALSVLLERQENILFALITSLLLHTGPNHRQVNWSLSIL